MHDVESSHPLVLEMEPRAWHIVGECLSPEPISESVIRNEQCANHISGVLFKHKTASCFLFKNVCQQHPVHKKLNWESLVKVQQRKCHPVE